MKRPAAIALRISAELKQRLEQATTKSPDPYAPTITKVVERGIELALQEMEERFEKGKKR